jgi:ribose transport system substrate-binding protein
LIPLLSKSLDILELFQREQTSLTLEAIHERTGIPKTTAYRILITLVHRGYLAHLPHGQYRLLARPKKARVGLGSKSSGTPFSGAVTESLKVACSTIGVDLVVLDNQYDGSVALRNADKFVRNRVDLVIEFQLDQHIAPVIAEKIHVAGIPLISVDVPHPHSTFFGLNNYRAGFDAGKCLTRYAEKMWNGKVHWAVGIDTNKSDPLVQSRVTGAFEAIRSQVPTIPAESLVRTDGNGSRAESRQIVRDFLRLHPKDRGILIAAADESGALGAAQAVRELKREKHVAIVGQDSNPEVFEEISRTDSPLIGSVSHEAQSYGPRLIHLGLSILNGHTVAPYNYIDHKVITGSWDHRVPSRISRRHTRAGINLKTLAFDLVHRDVTIACPRSIGHRQRQWTAGRMSAQVQGCSAKIASWLVSLIGREAGEGFGVVARWGVAEKHLATARNRHRHSTPTIQLASQLPRLGFQQRP